MILTNPSYDYSLKSIRQNFKDKGVFYTDVKLAEFLKSQFDDDVTEVYDPTCGNGNLLSVFDDSVKKYGQEIDETQLETAKERLVNFEGVAGDTLKEPGFWGKKFRSIIANPPFSVKWEPKADERFEACTRAGQALPLPPPSKADYAFILHCLYYLAEDGKAVILEFPGILYRGNKEGKIRQWLVENNYIEKVIHIEGNRFTDTSIATCCIVLSKSKKDTNILFIDSEREKERLVGFDEIKENNFTLSVNTYIPIEIEKENINPVELEMQARGEFFEKLRKELAFEKTVCEFENMDFSEVLEGVKKVVGEFEC